MILHTHVCVPKNGLVHCTIFLNLEITSSFQKITPSWCQTTAIKQIVASPGSEPVTIDNNVRVEVCYSYSIPRTRPAEPGELIGPYCDSCKPADSRCYHMTLHDDKNSSKTIQKRVQIITNCSCSSCDRIEAKDCEISDENTSELPSNLFALLHLNTSTEDQSKYSLPELPELLHMSLSEDENHSAIHISDITPEKKELTEPYCNSAIQANPPLLNKEVRGRTLAPADSYAPRSPEPLRELASMKVYASLCLRPSHPYRILEGHNKLENIEMDLARNEDVTSFRFFRFNEHLGILYSYGETGQKNDS
ncbi:uncharacterized protein LOC108734941 [Agrilus planipennis]|uniref:Uncharacterized protein LOC108734941 n=1 Tax=Agrilus planipennis TaxID=224129 RepID=A0A1W4WQA4_AGRPL|nr:uncharacterized protein LOC108734941 [Agrilus planipennis]